MLVALLGVINVSNYVSMFLQLRATSNTAAGFVMQGATDDAAVAAAALASWSGRPSDASVTLQRVYKCGDTLGDASSLCPDGTPPSVYVTIRASGSWDPPANLGALNLEKSLQFEQNLRTR
jgi:Flp pilus assembly protein TadG